MRQAILLLTLAVIFVAAFWGQDPIYPPEVSARRLSKVSKESKADIRKKEYIENLKSAQVQNRIEIMDLYERWFRESPPLDRFQATLESPPLDRYDARLITSHIYEVILPMYKDLLKSIRERKAPPEYQDFDKLLDYSVSNFIEAMEEIKRHLDHYLKNAKNNKGVEVVKETDHLTKSTAHYISATEAAKKLVKEPLYSELK